MSIQTIRPEAFQQLLSRGRNVTFLDVRTPAEFNKVHAVGARLIPLDQLDAIESSGKNPGQPIYVICQSGARSAKACERFEQAGIPEVFSVEGGTAEWERMGLPVERGTSKVISLERQVRIGAGVLILAGLLLAYFVHPAFVGISAFVGAGLIFAGVTNHCGMALLLAKMPWNR